MNRAPENPNETALRETLNQAISLFARGCNLDALAAAVAVLDKLPRNVQALNLAAACSDRLGRTQDTEHYLRRALAEKPDDAALNNNLGLLLVDLKRFSEADDAYRRALAVRPNFAEAHYNRGNVLKKILRDAEAAYLQALVNQPDYAEAHNNLGNVLYDMKRFFDAESAWRRALALRPDYAEAHVNLGLLLKNTKRFREAESAYRRAVVIRPDYADAHAHLGRLLKETKRFSEAERAYRRALAIEAASATTHNSLGNLLHETKRFEEAEIHYRQAFSIAPNHAEPYANLGLLLYDLKRYSEAEAAYRRALSIKPDYAEARLHLGILLLRTQRFSEGWPLYEARHDVKKSATFMRNPPSDCAQWQGESLKDKSIVVHCEQGFGDAIQFVRYLPLLEAMGARHVTLICAQALCALFEGIDGADCVRTFDDAASLPAHDYRTYLLSLPLRFSTTVHSIPATIPYLKPLADRLDAWKHRLPLHGLRIGLVWKGSAGHGNDRNRSLPALAALAPLWRIANVNFISLQKGPGEEEASAPPPEQPLINLGIHIRDFADSAAIVAQLDLVICVDTAIAHLAGALGKLCWVLLPQIGTDWRWLDDRTDSPWYPDTMRLFRQLNHDDWSSTIREVADALDNFAKAQ